MAHQASPDTSSRGTDTADTWHRWVEEVEIIRTQHQVSPQQGLYKRGRPVSRIRCMTIVLYVHLYYFDEVSSAARCIEQLGRMDVIVATPAICCLVCNLFSRVDNLVTSIWSPSVDT